MGLFSFLFPKKISWDYEAEAKIRREFEELEQDLRNSQRKRLAKQEAYEMFQEWREVQEYNKQWMRDNPTAKFAPRAFIWIGGDPRVYGYIIEVIPDYPYVSRKEYEEIRNEEFDKLKNNYNENTPLI